MTNLNPDSLYTEHVSAEVRNFLPDELADLVKDTLTLRSCYQKMGPDLVISDYAFMVFPLGKAYEGFLKLFFYRADIVSKDVYRATHFRIGRSFNPDLPQHLRDELWLYDNVERYCGVETARSMWQIWLEARNHLFHFFPDERYSLTASEADVLVEKVLKVMDTAIAGHPNLTKAVVQ